MPSADDTCASCGCPARPNVMTSPIAEMPGTLVRYCAIDLDVAALDREAGFLGVEARRHRPAAGRDQQVVRLQTRASCRRRVCASISTPSAVALALVTRAPVSTLMPCFLNDLSSSAETASSSTGTSRGSSSMIVTSLPKRRKIDANSTPTAPLPMIAIDFGISLQPDGFVAGDDARAIDFDPRHAARRRPGRDDDFLARRERLVLAVGHFDPALAGEPRRALDPVDLVLLEQELDALGQAR